MNYISIKKRIEEIQAQTSNQNTPAIVRFIEDIEQNKWEIQETYYNKKNIGKTKTIYVSDYKEYIEKLDKKIHKIFYSFGGKPIFMILKKG